jgi:hypothetical protein
MMSEQRFPPGWDNERVRRLIAHEESQTDDEQVVEDEAIRRRAEMWDASFGTSHEETWRRIDDRDGNFDGSLL